MRGFVVLVVLLMLAVISVVAIGQLAVVSSQGAISIRREEEAQARALAEGCLLLLQRHAERFMDGTDTDLLPDSPPPSDFDRLLNPNRSTDRDGDEHVPTNITDAKDVKIPKGASGTSEHQWQLVRRDGGACFLRYEDNSDDGLLPDAQLPDSTADCALGATAEGTGKDINFCDRDGSIYLTAIGVFPANADTGDDDVYARAHARVTLRKLFQVSTPGTFPAAISAGGNVDIKNNMRLCGVGGIAANDVVGKLKGTSCLCGSVQTTQTLESTPPLGNACCANCAGGTASSGNAAPRKFDVNGDATPCSATSTPPCGVAPNEPGMPSSPLQPTLGATFLGNNGFGDPRAKNNDIADPNICSFYLGPNGRVFYWDQEDTDANAYVKGLAPPAGLNLVGIPAGIENCTIYTADPVGSPCDWDFVGNPAATPVIPPSITCSAGTTTCWKPLAILGDGATTVVDFNVPAVPEFTDGTGNSLQVRAGRLPNSKGTGTLTAAPQLCGALGAPAANSVISSAGGGNYTVRSTTTPLDLPTAVLVVPGALTLQAKAARGAYQNLTILAGGNVTVGDNWNLSCARCGGQAPTDMNLTTGANGTCRISAAAGIAGATYATQSQTVLASNSSQPGENRPVPGFVVKTQGTLNWGSYTLAGLTYTSNTFTAGGGSPCFVGRLVVDTPAGTDSFEGKNNATINVAGEWLNTGKIAGDANNITIVGDLYTEGDATFKNNWTLIGRLLVNGNLDVKNNAKIDFDGGGATGTFGANALSTYMESQW